MSVLYLRGGIHVDQLELGALTPQHIRDDREIPGTKRCLIEHGGRTTALSQHFLRLCNGRRQTIRTGDHDSRMQSLHDFVERTPLPNRDAGLDRLLERLMNFKPKPLVTLQPRQKSRFDHPSHWGYATARGMPVP